MLLSPNIPELASRKQATPSLSKELRSIKYRTASQCDSLLLAWTPTVTRMGYYKPIKKLVVVEVRSL
jgi:hypothetical protein